MKGNKDEKFVEERRALLERFLREIAQYDYLIESKEFKPRTIDAKHETLTRKGEGKRRVQIKRGFKNRVANHIRQRLDRVPENRGKGS